MPTTTRMDLPYPLGSDAADVPAVMQALAEAVEDGTFRSGTTAGRPSATGLDGLLYWDTDKSILYIAYGGSWMELYRHQQTPGRLIGVPVLGSSVSITATTAAGADTIASFAAHTPKVSGYHRVELDVDSIGFPSGGSMGRQLALEIWNNTSRLAALGSFFKHTSGADQVPGMDFSRLVSLTAGTTYNLSIRGYIVGDAASVVLYPAAWSGGVDNKQITARLTVEA